MGTSEEQVLHNQSSFFGQMLEVVQHQQQAFISDAVLKPLELWLIFHLRKAKPLEDGCNDQVRIIERRQQGGSSGNQQNAEDRLAALLEEYDLARDAGMSAVEAALKANRLLDTHDFKASKIEKAPDGKTEKPGKR